MIHELSDVKSKNIGERTRIWQFSIVLENAIIGKNCNINCHVFIENDVIIGDNVTIKPGVQIWDGVTIQNNAFIGSNVTFTNDITPRSKQYPKEFAKTIVEEGASIGANATILPENVIGKYSLIGAGSVVTKSVPPFTVWRGNPAKHTGYITKNGELISLQLLDKNGNKYILQNGEPVLK